VAHVKSFKEEPKHQIKAKVYLQGTTMSHSIHLRDDSFLSWQREVVGG
jgi:hypothetical protein